MPEQVWSTVEVLYTHFISKLGQSSEGRHEVTDQSCNIGIAFNAEPNNDGKTTSLFSAAPFTIQAGEGGGGNTYRSTTNGGGTQGDNREVDGDSMAKEKPADLCRAEGEADEEVMYIARNS